VRPVNNKTMDPRTHDAVTWLLSSGEPAVRLLARRDVLGEPPDADAGQVLAGAKVTALLSGQHGDGVHPYRKWTGAHWRLVSLAELWPSPRENRVRWPPLITSLPGLPDRAGASR
jgi:hypothetical protein